ncbi:hypothetical protein GCM10009734_80880 [Nonomuraea bangladeshensis]
MTASPWAALTRQVANRVTPSAPSDRNARVATSRTITVITTPSLDSSTIYTLDNSTIQEEGSVAATTMLMAATERLIGPGSSGRVHRARAKSFSRRSPLNTRYSAPEPAFTVALTDPYW